MVEMTYEECLKQELRMLKFYKWFLIVWIPILVGVIIAGFVVWDNISRLAVFCLGICLASLPYHIRDLRTALHEINETEQEISHSVLYRNFAPAKPKPEINPRTGKPYKTSKAHRDAMKRYQAKRKAEMK